MLSFSQRRAFGALGLAHVFSACTRNLTLQDSAVMCLCVWLTLKTLYVVHNTQAYEALVPVCSLLGVGGLTILLVRGDILPRGAGRAVFYRCGMFGTLAASYFVLRPVLAAMHAHLFDRELLGLDNLLFGETPALYLDRYVSRFSVEWFAFFYYAFYGLLGVYVIGALVFDRGRSRYELLVSVALVMSIGQIMYTIVPGTGPLGCPGLRFDHVLRGGIWWERVQRAVQSAGAKLDIFPSLHTALPLVMSSHAFRYRRRWPFNWLCAPTWFTTANIVIATVFLRWHYGVDLLAGLTLAVAAQRVAIHAWTREGTAAARSGRQPVWEPALPEDMDPADRRFVVVAITMQFCAIAWLVMFA